MTSNSVLIEDNFDESLKLIDMKLQPIANDGNCFFRAISDQLYGHQNMHWELRKATTDYMRTHPQDFMPWIVVGAGAEGELRRSASRAAKEPMSKAAAFFNSLSKEESDRISAATYKKYIDNMAKDCKWAGELEMKALSNAMQINICIYSKKSNRTKKLAEMIVEYNRWTPFTRTAKIIRHEYSHFSSVQPRYPQFGEWRGLKPKAKQGPQTHETAPITQPNTASTIFAPQAPTCEIRGAVQSRDPQSQPPTKTPQSSEKPLPTPPHTPEKTNSPPHKTQKPSKHASSGASPQANNKPTTSKLSAPAGITKPKPKPRTVITTGEPKYMYPGEKLPMTKTAMRMKCGFLGKSELTLFKKVEKNEDGTPKQYPSDQKITIFKAST